MVSLFGRGFDSLQLHMQKKDHLTAAFLLHVELGGENLYQRRFNVLERANAWSETAVPEGRQANVVSAFTE